MWKRSWTVSIVLLICLIYALGLLQDEQFIQAYNSWIPQRLGEEYEDPIVLVLNSTYAPFNISLEFSNCKFFLNLAEPCFDCCFG
jgi:hypothetical protein